MQLRVTEKMVNTKDVRFGDNPEKINLKSVSHGETIPQKSSTSIYSEKKAQGYPRSYTTGRFSQRRVAARDGQHKKISWNDNRGKVTVFSISKIRQNIINTNMFLFDG
jgi:hypothetical protein